MYRYNKISEKLSKLTLDGYNRQDSELTFVEAKIVKSENFLTIYGAILPGISGKFSNITKPKKLDDGKWGNDPDFKFPVEGLEANPMPLVMIQIPLKSFTNDKGKDINPSVSEEFIAKKLLEDFGDNGAFEGMIDLGIDKSRIEKYEEYIALGEMGMPKANKVLSEFYEISKIDTLTVITNEILLATGGGSGENKNGGYGGKTYAPKETESERLNARAEFAKRFLADDWDKTKDFSVITFDSCLTLWDGRSHDLGQSGCQYMTDILKNILS
ncbi:hypothetical protein PL11201_490093 [Planktothrix sp. PCC 11201]|uniref:hypothetical protein n=1 Tax=Planktothrix sp. PCC 11201 TaxID=1729650 RepID=UPI00091C0C50|nr:hypothetical protein [Planktothrix sp. PCC 11201]SKB13358.1 hypothetical protein PL11201_490093 [Planktothrix sp. PCC 11201]